MFRSISAAKTIAAGAGGVLLGISLAGAGAAAAQPVPEAEPVMPMQQPPYPRSERITAVSFGEMRKYTPDRAGDNWPITWADDGHQYTAWGDGRGPQHPDGSRVSMGFARVEGDPPEVRLARLASADEQSGDGRRGRKASGMIMVDGVLYMWVRNDNRDGTQCRLWWSNDRGVSWRQADWRFEELGYLTFVNYGQDNRGARDEYVYSVSHDAASAYDYADDFVLMRVPAAAIAERGRYEFFGGLDEAGEPIWTADFGARRSVFHHAGRCQRSSISFNPHLGRYLWWQSGWPNPQGQDSRFHDSPLGIYEAPAPWGPWRTVYYNPAFPRPGETGGFPVKWMQPVRDGRQVVQMLSSTDDAFSVYPVILSIRE